MTNLANKSVNTLGKFATGAIGAVVGVSGDKVEEAMNASKGSKISYKTIF
ncbi:MAG: hypothetical protein J6U79_04105 [Paludibacteraceae bacterium]|nr:hypothetical protein [Paludibacteraceae bacterium]